MPSFAVRNFGCRANQAEAFAWADEFRARGFRLEEDWGRGDVVVVNSCTLTGRAERDVRKFIRAVHRRNPGSKIVVTGCYAERAPAEMAGLAGVVAVLPQSAKDGLADRVLAIGAASRPVQEETSSADRSAIDPLAAGCPTESVEPAFRARGWLKIQDGCDGRCTFCVLPSVRGRSRSVTPGVLAASVRDLARRGFREIVLAGIHISSYGRDLEPAGSLGALLGELGRAAGGSRLRLSSLDPRQTDEALIERVAEDPAICPHFHLSLQHASDRILKAMGRPVDPGSYERILEDLRRRSPDAALGADLIVGFPGETDADFEALRRFVDGSALTYAHVFSYSPRPETPAASKPRLPEGVVTERAKALRRVAALQDFRFRRRFIGGELDAVVISKGDGGAEVLTGNSIKVLVPECEAPERERVRVSIRRVLPRRTEGEIVP